MPRIINEIHDFSREQLEELGRFAAKMTIVGPIYKGQLGEQVVQWLPDGTLRVFTYHEPE